MRARRSDAARTHCPAWSLAQNFFPKWHAVLHAWLSATPNFDEVTRWYLGWKGLFPEEVRTISGPPRVRRLASHRPVLQVMSHERVRRGFNAALDMMNQVRRLHRHLYISTSLTHARRRLEQAVAGQLGPPPNAPAPPVAASAAMPPHSTGAALPPFEEERGCVLCLARRTRSTLTCCAHSYGGGLSLRELVENVAEQNDVLFMPKPGRTHAGMQVYSFGGVSVVIDAAREEMLAQRLDGDRGWVPASIEQLLEMHAARKGPRK